MVNFLVLKCGKELEKAKMFLMLTKWVIGRDSDLRFWMDNWSSQGPIRNLVQGPLTRDEGDIKVKEMISANH